MEMKQKLFSLFLTMLMSMVGINAFASDFEVKNEDGVTIYYNYINDGKELEVTRPSNGYGYYESVIRIPEEVTYMNRTRKVTSIGYRAFYGNRSLTSVTIPNSVTTIGDGAFSNCISMTSITIPNSVTSIGNEVFFCCAGITSITIPNSVTSIGDNAFDACSGLTSVTIPNSVTFIGEFAFFRCHSLTSVTIPNSVTSIGNGAFSAIDLSSVISNITEPFKISGKNSNHDATFSINTFNNATLYVPAGTLDKYKATEGWKDFMFIEEGTGGGGSTTSERCARPTIRYQNGKLSFYSTTDGATYQYSITDSDIKTGSAKEVQLGVTYNISVYATKAGYEDSETAKATLCWIDVDPKTEGISNGVANVRATAVMIQSQNGMLTIQGVDEGSDIAVYNVSGHMVGSTKAIGNQASLATNIKKGEVAIIKIGEKSVKVVMQ